MTPEKIKKILGYNAKMTYNMDTSIKRHAKRE